MEKRKCVPCSGIDENFFNNKKNKIEQNTIYINSVYMRYMWYTCEYYVSSTIEKCCFFFDGGLILKFWLILFSLFAAKGRNYYLHFIYAFVDCLFCPVQSIVLKCLHRVNMCYAKGLMAKGFAVPYSILFISVPGHWVNYLFHLWWVSNLEVSSNKKIWYLGFLLRK